MRTRDHAGTHAGPARLGLCSPSFYRAILWRNPGQTQMRRQEQEQKQKQEQEQEQEEQVM